MKKLVLILAIIALNFSAVAVAAKMLESREVVAYRTTNAEVDGLHIALPNNMRGFAVENLVPLP